MKSFLGIIDKKGKLDPRVHDKITFLASRFLACAPGMYQSEMWQSPSQRVVLYGFSNETLPEYEPTLRREGNKVFTIAGYINHSFPEFLDNLFCKCRSESELQKLFCQTGGLYSACLVDGDQDIITVWNTITRIVPVYWVENSQHIVVSDRALLAHIFAQDSLIPDYDLLNLGYFIGNGYYNSESTPYKNVNILLPNSRLKISALGIKVEPLDDTEAREPFLIPDDRFYDDMAHALIESLLPVKKHQLKIAAALTGGKDSRLLIAGLTYINADFEASTSGFPENPEVIVAKMVAATLNIPHHVNVPRVSTTHDGEYLTQDLFKRTRDALFITDGMVSAYENTGRHKSFSPNNVRIGGDGGELYKGGFHAKITDDDSQHLQMFFERRFLKHHPFIRPQPLEVYRKNLKNWLEAQPHWFTPIDFDYKYYLHYRSGRWSASERAGFTSGYYFYEPFFDAKLAKMVRWIPCKYGQSEEIGYNLMKRLAPALVDVPFYNKRWAFESDGPRPGEEDSWKKRTPLTGKPKTRATFDWRLTCLTDMKEAFYEQILNSSSSERLFEIVKKEAIQELFDSSSNFKDNSSINLFLWHLFSASILLSNQWLNETGPSKTVTIKVLE